MAQGGGILPPGADGIAIYSVYRNTLEHSPKDYRNTLEHSPKDYRNTSEHRGSSFYNLTIKTTHAIVRYSLGAEERGTFYEVNGRREKHVEHIVTERLEKKLGAGSKETKEKMEVYMYMNFSPCDYQDGAVSSRCCTKLVDFTNDHPGIDLHVRFVGLYNINRQSCLGKNCTHLQGFSVDEAVSNQNEEGLRKLVRAGVHVRVFTADDWRFVHDFLCQGKPTEDSQADTPQKGSQADTPQKGSQADTPQASSDGNKLEEGMKRMTLDTPSQICKICQKNLGERVEDKKMKKDLEHIVSPSQGTGGE